MKWWIWGDYTRELLVFVGYWGLERLDYLSSLCICPLKLDFVMLSILALDN
jgi:hypothetical protein